MALYTVRYIAKYEMRTLLRSWFFRIFAGLFILGLGIFNITIKLESSGGSWIFRALDASIPYANLIILNIGQAIVAVFLASEFMKHDRKNDTVEVIYTRSMTNGEYIFGKTIGILMVFFVLNILILSIGLGSSFLSAGSSRNILALLIYPLIISLPTLIYILGLSFFAMLLLKNQAITFIVVLGYIAVSVFYLNTKAYHIFDFIAYYVPMMYSSFGGFGDLTEIIIHRGIYLLMGISFIFFTVYRLNRLPQSKWFESFPLICAIVFMLFAGLFSWKYITDIKDRQSYKQAIVALNNRYCFYPRATITKCNIKLKHQDEKISVKASIVLLNEDSVKIDTLILSLNPGLKISELKIQGQKVSFKCEEQIVKIWGNILMNPGDSLIADIQYSGSIDERVCFVDLNNKDGKESFYLDLFHVKKRHAWITSDFVCLNPSSLWYPIPGVGYATQKAFYYSPDFAKYTLDVTTAPSLTAISQGICKPSKTGEFEFRPDNLLPSLSLIIGNYKKYTVTTDSVAFSLFTRKGNEYFEPYFKNIADTVPAIIRDLKHEYEKNIGFTYPLSYLTLVEVPVHFGLDNHVWAYASDAVQPGMVLYSEKGVSMWDTDFRHRKYREEKNMKKNNEEVTPKELQVRMFKQVMRNNFLKKQDENTLYEGLITNATYSIFPCFVSYVTSLRCEKWPEFTIGYESYLIDRNSSGSGTQRQFWEALTQDEWVILKLKDSSLESMVKAYTRNDSNALSITELRKIVLAKGRQFFDILEAKYGKAVFDTSTNQLIANKKFSIITFDTLHQVFERNFGFRIDEDIKRWYSEKNLPGYIVSNIQTYKVIRNEKTENQLKFVVSNPENADGCFVVNIELKDNKRDRGNDPFRQDKIATDFTRKYFVPAKSARELGFIFSVEPARMGIYTFISQNLPNVLAFEFSGFNELRKVPAFDTISVYDPQLLKEDSDEIIVDNEDPEFTLIQESDQPFLKRLLHKKDQEKNKYSIIRFWGPPSKWEAVLRSDFYGKYLHSGLYTKGGSGNKKAIWEAHLPYKSKYDVYCYIPKIEFNFGPSQNKKVIDYNFLISHDDGVQKVTLKYDDIENGWNMLGSFYISGDTGRVEMTNKSAGNIIYADAVKWVRVR